MAGKPRPASYDDVIAVLEVLPIILRETRRRKGLSTRAAAIQLGMTHATISRWEGGHHAPGRDAIIRVLRWAAS